MELVSPQCYLVTVIRLGLVVNVSLNYSQSLLFRNIINILMCRNAHRNFCCCIIKLMQNDFKNIRLSQLKLNAIGTDINTCTVS